jgi:hypothetical protein
MSPANLSARSQGDGAGCVCVGGGGGKGGGSAHVAALAMAVALAVSTGGCHTMSQLHTHQQRSGVHEHARTRWHLQEVLQ